MKNPSDKCWLSLVLTFFACRMLIFLGVFIAYKYFLNSIEAQFLCMIVVAVVAFVIAATILAIKFRKAYEEEFNNRESTLR